MRSLVSFRRKRTEDEREPRVSMRSTVSCAHCGTAIEVRNVDSLADEFVVMCPRCHRRSFRTRADLQQSRQSG